MKLQILAVGKARVPYFAAGIDEYIKRIRHYLPIEQVEVPEGTGGDSNGHGSGAVSREGEKLSRLLRPGTRLVTLEATGRQFTSEALSEWLQKEMAGSTERIAFVIGGAWGIDKQLTEAAHLKLSLSSMTFPHELARMMLLEQLYRALTLWKGHPYHK